MLLFCLLLLLFLFDDGIVFHFGLGLTRSKSVEKGLKKDAKLQKLNLFDNSGKQHLSLEWKAKILLSVSHILYSNAL